jgi:hypothetical protein
MSNTNASVSHQATDTSLKIIFNTPCFPSSTPKENQTNICKSSKNPLSQPSLALWSQPPKSDTIPTQVIPYTTTPLADTVDNTIEHTLNALSLFQRPIQLFSNITSPSTSQSNPNSLNPSQLDPPQKKPTSNDQNKPTTPIDSNPTDTNLNIFPNATDNTCHTTNKQARRTPYNTKHTKKLLISI